MCVLRAGVPLRPLQRCAADRRADLGKNNNVEFDQISIPAGIEQDCQLSGTIFAIALDPLAQAHLAATTLRSSKICSFVVATKHLRHQTSVIGSGRSSF